MFKLFRSMTKREAALAAAALAFVVVQVWLELRIPDYMNDITKLVQTGDNAISAVLRSGGKMLLCAFGSLLASVVVAFAASRIASNFGAALRLRLFDRVQAFSMEEIGRFSTASLITRSTNDVTQIQDLIVLGLQAFIRAPVMAAFAIGKIADKNSAWTFSTAAAVGILLVIVIITLVTVMPKFRSLQRLTDDVNRVTRENLNGINVVHAYNAEDYQQKKFGAANDALTGAHLFTGHGMAMLMPSIALIMNGLSLAIYWIGAYLIEHAALMEKAQLFADMVVFSSYAMQVVMSFMMLVMIFLLVPRASVSAKRINEVLDTVPALHDGKETAGLSTGEIEFRDVSFSYPDSEEAVLRHISFRAHKGETVAFIGSTGSGKSTLVNLIPRFYDATEGQVLVDGRDVRDYTLEALHDRIGHVAQKAVLFSGTIAGNVAYGENGKPAPSAQDVDDAIAVAQATEFVSQKSDGANSYVAQGGTNFSGGQKQRLSIARAVCRKPEILIFDDSFSALDFRTDRILRESLRKSCGEATKLIVAQRIGTIRDADRIVVLDEGAVAGIGTHDELMKSCEVYRQIAFSQLSEAELA